MFAIAFDLSTAAANRHHPRQNRGAYEDIRATLATYGFEPIQGSTYAAKHEDQTKLFLALTALREFEWIGATLENLRVFRMEAGADFTLIIQTPR